MDKYLKLPFIMGGRDWNGVDCYGLTRLFLMEEMGIELPPFSGTIDKREIVKQTKKSKDIYGHIVGQDYQFGDIFILKSISDGIHYGVYIGNNEMLHTTQRKGTCIENVGYQNIENLLLWVYRIDVKSSVQDSC